MARQSEERSRSPAYRILNVPSVSTRGSWMEAGSLHDIAGGAFRKGCPLAVGVCLPGAGVQVTGPPLPQLKVTELEYPFTEVRIPLRVAVPVTPAVCGELLILIV